MGIICQFITQPRVLTGARRSFQSKEVFLVVDALIKCISLFDKQSSQTATAKVIILKILLLAFNKCQLLAEAVNSFVLLFSSAMQTLKRRKINKDKTAKRDIWLLTFDTCNNFGQTRSEIYMQTVESTYLHVK